MNVTFWGVRGSIPSPGSETARWGGNSSCIEIRHPGFAPLVLDCGTGARKLGIKLLGEETRELDLLFTHLHMDHVFGFPFFLPIYTPGYAVRVMVPAFNEGDAKDKLARYLNGMYHPALLRELPAQVTFHAARTGRTFQAGGFKVKAMSLNHPGGSLGYRIEADGHSVAYLTDTAPFARPGEGVASGSDPTTAEARMLSFLSGCDLVLYDTMFNYTEYLEKMTWGHSYPEYAVALCAAAKVGKLVLFHHLPDATDEDLDALELHWKEHRGPRVVLAKEGCTLDVGD